MSYYFPGFINSTDVRAEVPPELHFTVNSGKNALRLLLRSLNLEKKSKVGIPAFVCAATHEAVTEEGLEPFQLDLYPKSFWTHYDQSRIVENNVRAIVLVHLYGFIHPDTQALTDFCLEHRISLVHDAAQSYGIDEDLLLRGNGIVYSFGPGKTLTGAGGGWIKGIDENYYAQNCIDKASDAGSKHFLESRIYGYKPSLMSKIRSKMKPHLNEKGILKMSSFALKANAYVLSQLDHIRKVRKKNYDALTDAVRRSKNLSILYDDNKGQYFKLIIGVENDPAGFKKYLKVNDVPYFCLGDRLPGMQSLKNYSRWRGHLVEISTEASLPWTEVQRVAAVLKKFN